MITGIAQKNQTKNLTFPILSEAIPSDSDMPSAWQRQLANAVRDPLELIRLLELSPEPWVSLEAAQSFSTLVTQSYLARMRKADWSDPLLRQVLPLTEELINIADYGVDPVGDQHALVSEGVLHKYYNRVLLVTTGACAIHCRYCFRRHFPYSEATASRNHWQAALDYLATHPEVDEVILSGGDPLVLSDQRLFDLCHKLETIKHLKRIRIHSRLPIVLPERIDESFINGLQALQVQLVLVVHANHAQELEGEAIATAFRRLRRSGLILLNQSVLLRGVNDSVVALKALSEALIVHSILPYYLHYLDKVQGASHFALPLVEAQQLIRQLRSQISGYLVPELVVEEAGKPAKTPIPTSD